MELKRKRSGSELSASTISTSGSPFQLVDSVSPPSADVPMSIDSFAFSRNCSVSMFPQSTNRNLPFPHVSGRTMKRFRDNRPSEQEVHQRTLNALYAAQRQHATAAGQNIPTAGQQRQCDGPVAVQSGPSLSSQQTNLHKFWNLPSCPSASPAEYLPSMPVDTPTECEDCGQKFGGDDDDTMMDMDGTSDSVATSCCACGKYVCSPCSISNLGEQRRCLGCAGTVSVTARAGHDADRISLARGMSNWLC